MKKKKVKQVKKQIVELKKSLGTPTNAEIKELEKELSVLEDKDTSYGSPKQPINVNMELILTTGNFAVFKNANGILYQMYIGLDVEEIGTGELVLKKIKCGGLNGR